VAGYYSSLGQRCQAEGNLGQARECYRQALRHHWFKPKTWVRSAWLEMTAGKRAVSSK
jgi:hypothetical protein